MKLHHVAAPALLLSMVVLMTGCIGIRAEKIYTEGPTLGQELTDLKQAHEQGAIDDAEYARLRSRLIDGDAPQ